ncbi:FUSC family protein [Azorhizobium doebereinerae]|uniref:FUSC family protein n=1 Tax=Azorhizobium doebereinerae TaxID=281091 RepID=UPI00048F36F1|nr:FUSC family protein [Azorhizobium doebereinerae]
MTSRRDLVERLRTRGARWIEPPLAASERYAVSALEDLAAFSLTGHRAQVALRVTLGILVAIGIAHALRLEMPVWAAISVLRVCQNDRSATVKRGLERVAGTLAGGFIAYVIMLGGAVHGWVYVATGLACAAAVYAQAVSRYSYAFVLVGFTVPLMTYHALTSDQPIGHVIVMRGLEVLVGVCVATAVDMLTSVGKASPPKKPLFGETDAVFLGHALTVGIAVALVPVVWTVFHLPGFEQTPITAFIVVGAAREGIGWKSLNRCIGCLIGAAVGFLGLLVLDGSLWTWLAFVFVGLFVFTQVCFGGSVIAYTGVQAGIAFLLVMVQEPIPHLDVAAGIGRMWGIAGGIAMVVLVGLATWPIRRRIAERLQPRGLHEAAH